MGEIFDLFDDIRVKCSMPSKADIAFEHTLYILRQTQSMFKWGGKGINTSIPDKWLERYLQVNRNAFILSVNSELVAVRGGWGGEPDRYYIPSNYVVQNPYIPPEYNGTKKIGVDGVLIYNDTYNQGLMPLISYYSNLLAENAVSLRIALINSRMTNIFKAMDGTTKDSAELYIKHIIDGDLAIITDCETLTGASSIEINPGASNVNLNQYIEVNQYLLSQLNNRLGLQTSYNMKRERMNVAETALNDDILFPAVENMLKERKEGCERVNDLFGLTGTDAWTVELSSSWRDNVREKNNQLEKMKGDVENVNTDDNAAE